MCSDNQDMPVIGIVAIGYNRTDSLGRLLKRLNDCCYPETDVPLVVSLDNCGKNDLYEYARNFPWRHGTLQVILQPERLGLRRHVMRCGQYMEEYNWDAQIVLEDDVFPGGAFYEYARQAVLAYRDDDRIAGISLFGLPQNQTAQLPFIPMQSDYDAYFVQLAQSCGQVWMRKQWQDYLKWYEQNSEPFRACPGVPDNVCRWPEKSWLKYHIRYCVETGKYFSYPYVALTANFSDIGENTSVRNCTLQCVLQNEPRGEYLFPKLDRAPVLYDAWCENTGLSFGEYIAADDVCADIYGMRADSCNKRFWLTTRAKPFRVVEAYDLSLMPADMNIACRLPGNSIFLYDTSEAAEAPAVSDRDLMWWGFYNRFVWPNDAIVKLAKPLYKKIWKSRFKLILRPKELYRRIRGRLRER